MFNSLLLVGFGLLLLVVGGEVLLRGAVGLAQLLKMTPAVIGLTVVAAGTSVPELSVSFAAAVQDKTDIAVGNVVGSNIVNICCILGICAIVRPLTISGNMIRLEYPVMALVTLASLAVMQDGTVNRLDAILLLAMYVGFLIYLVQLVQEQMNREELKDLTAEVTELAEQIPRRSSGWLSCGLVVGGVVLLGGGAQMTVQGAIEMARWIGLSERVIGLTIVAVGTSLPEIVTSLVSSIRGRDDVAIGNVIGSNLFNLCGILGLSGLIAPLHVHPAIVSQDNWWMLAATVALFPLMYTGRRVTRWEGSLLLGVYLTYTYFLIRGPS